jgi:acetyl-CoA acyltransferase 1
MASAQQRLSQVSSQLNLPAPKEQILQKNPDDIVITFAIRSALCNARNGAFKDTPLQDLLIALLKGVIAKSQIDPKVVEEVVVGNVLKPDVNYIARGSVLAAGFPATTGSSIVNRWCSSGLLAVQSVANQIISGGIDVGLAVGAESMSSSPDKGAPDMGKIMEHPVAKDIAMPMGWTSENLASDYGISREEQDDWAAESSQKAERAQKAGWVEEEILPIEVEWVDPKTKQKVKKVADRDDGVRYGTTKEGLAKIRKAFPQWPPSTTTGGNASQITDGVAAVLMMRRKTAEKLGQPILAKYVGSTVAGLEPRIMGAGPTIAVPKLLGKLGLRIEDIDLFEINEAFGSVVCVESFRPHDRELTWLACSLHQSPRHQQS